VNAAFPSFSSRRLRTVAEPRHEEVGQPILIGVADRSVHGPRGFADGVERDTHLAPDLAEVTLAVVQPKRVRRVIVRHVEIHVTVEIGVERGHRHGAMPRGVQAGGAGDIFEGAIASVSEEDVGFARIGEGARVGSGVLIRGLVRGVGQVIAHEKVKPTVVVDVDEDGSDASAGMADAGLGGDVFEGAVAPVPIQGIPADIDDVQVRVSVVIEVAGHRRAAEPASLESRAGGDVLEGAVGAVSVEAVWLSGRGGGGGGHARKWPPVDKEKVHPAVAVEIKHRTAGTVREKNVRDARGAELVDEVDARAPGHILKQIAGSGDDDGGGRPGAGG
jgi:hypothetical protein